MAARKPLTAKQKAQRSVAAKASAAKRSSRAKKGVPLASTHARGKANVAKGKYPTPAQRHALNTAVSPETKKAYDDLVKAARKRNPNFKAPEVHAVLKSVGQPGKPKQHGVGNANPTGPDAFTKRKTKKRY